MHFIFDLHRTLIYYPHSHGHFLSRYIDLDPEEFNRALGTTLQDIENAPNRRVQKMLINGEQTESRSAWLSVFHESLNRMGIKLNPENDEYLLKSYDRLQEPTNWEVYGNTIPTLKALVANHHSIGILSNFDWRWKAIVDFYFSDIQWQTKRFSCLTQKIKPETEAFSDYLTKSSITAEKVIMIGDDPVQDGACQKVGIKYLQVSHPEQSLEKILHPWLKQ